MDHKHRVTNRPEEGIGIEVITVVVTPADKDIDEVNFRLSLHCLLRNDLQVSTMLCRIEVDLTLRKPAKLTLTWKLPRESSARWKSTGDETDNSSRHVLLYNIRIMALRYAKICVNCLSHLLSLNSFEAEEYIGKLVTKKTIFARVDMTDKVRSFSGRRRTSVLLCKSGPAMSRNS
ncbi:hypothetical protein RvY_17952-1 [Ramazzottius varieornatus]|uniref:Uncharacterized protein n=1 Tax=Ramazzottius varieornatus TaxID=947166 RepID=A0A1D1W418_RAMVA|nr:hypothetical protein RvY_17952-1 [Ramazzottius varieornatus]